jgi:tetratricopeptide (TPR) repeat protein
MRFRLVGIVLGFWCVGLASSAASSPKERMAEVREHYESGMAHYNLKEYKAAIDEFSAAYRIKPDPALLYNLAQAYRLADDPDQALHFYRTYLRSVPEASNRTEVQERIAALEKAIADKKAAAEVSEAPVVTTPAAPAPQLATATPTQQPTSATPHVTKQPAYKKWWVWTVAGVAAGGLAVGLGVGLTQSRGQAFNANVGTYGPGALTLRF